MAEGLEALKGISGAVSIALDTLLGPLSELSEGLKNGLKSLTGFVDALSPGSLKVLELAFRDLYATIGTALLPVVNVFTEGIHNMAGALLPAMQAIAPVFNQLANVALSVLIPIVNQMSVIFQTLAPVLSEIAGLFKVVADIIGVYIAIQTTLFQVIAGFIGGLVGGGVSGALDKFKNVIYQVIGIVLKLLTALAPMIGLGDIGDKLAKNLEAAANPPAAGVGGAAQNIGLKGLEQISKDLAVAAASAVGGGEAKKDKGLLDYLPDLTADLRAIKDKDLATVIVEALTNDKVKKAFGDLISGVGNVVAKEARDTKAGGILDVVIGGPLARLASGGRP